MSAKKVIDEAKKMCTNNISIYGIPKLNATSFVVNCYKKALGIILPNYLGELMNKGNKVTKDTLKPGDLVFPSQHLVGIYIGNNQFIHWPTTGDVCKISHLNNLYTARRIINE